MIYAIYCIGNNECSATLCWLYGLLSNKHKQSIVLTFNKSISTGITDLLNEGQCIDKLTLLSRELLIHLMSERLKPVSGLTRITT